MFSCVFKCYSLPIFVLLMIKECCDWNNYSSTYKNVMLFIYK